MFATAFDAVEPRAFQTDAHGVVDRHDLLHATIRMGQPYRGGLVIGLQPHG